jgi:hypothetical protein
MERFLIVDLSTAWLAVVMSVISVAVALVGLVLVRRYIDHRRMHEHHDVAGFLIAVVGVIYAVLLAFTVIIQWESYSAAGDHAEAEAAAIGGLYRDSVALGKEGRPLRLAVIAYANQIAFTEWPYMSKHLYEDTDTDVYRNAVWKAVTDLKASAPTQQEFVKEAVTDVAAVSATRRVRLEDASSMLPTPLWTVLIIGGVLTIVFCYFFGLANAWAQAGMLTILALLIGLSLFVILALDLPYSGGVAGKPNMLIAEIHEFCSYNFVHPHAEACP